MLAHIGNKLLTQRCIHCNTYFAGKFRLEAVRHHIQTVHLKKPRGSDVNGNYRSETIDLEEFEGTVVFVQDGPTTHVQ